MNGGERASGGSAERSVLEICDYHGPYPGNFIPSLIATGEAVEDRLGLSYHCVFPEVMRDRPWVEMLERVGVSHSFLRSDTSRLGTIRAISRLARERDACLIRSHFSKWDLEAGLTGRHVHAATVWHMHSGRGGKSAPVKSAVKDAVKVGVLGRVCDRVIAVSDEIGSLARTRGFPERKIRVVGNGIDLSRFVSLPPRAAARRSLGIDSDVLVALAFAWSPYTKGADILVEAARAEGRTGGLLVLLVGGDELGSLFGADAGSWLRLVPPRDDVVTLFAAADVFVSPSRDEGFSYAIGEAMSCALPVVSSDIRGPSAYFAADGVSIFRNEDSESLAEVLRALTVLPAEERAELGRSNRRFIQEHFGLESHVDRVIEVFGELLDPH